MDGADRRDLRRRARAARAAFVGGLAPQVRAGLQAALAWQLLAQLKPDPFILGTYRAVGDEIDPAVVARLRPDLAMAWPRVTGADQPLCFHSAPAHLLRPSVHGIPEPPADAPVVTPGVLLVPLLLVDRSGNRLGQGGGHYDRTLSSLRARGPLLAIGLAWDIQLAEQLDPEPWDAPLDAIATPSAFHWCAAGAKANP